MTDRRTDDKPPSRRFATGLISAFAVAAVAAALVFYLRDSGKDTELAAITDSTAAACAYAGVLADFDYATGLDTFLESVAAGAAGPYASEFGAAKDGIKTAMINAEARSRAEGLRCGWVSGTSDTATVLVAVTQYRTSAGQPVEQRSDVTLELRMERSPNGKWLVNEMDSPLLKGGPGVFGGGGSAVPTPDQEPTSSNPEPAPSAPEPTPGN